MPRYTDRSGVMVAIVAMGVGWLRGVEDVRKRIGANRLPINFFARHGRTGSTGCSCCVIPCDRPCRIRHRLS
jgi:hypothetical protein